MGKEAAANYSAEIQRTDVRSPKYEKKDDESKDEYSVKNEIPDLENGSNCGIFRVPRTLRNLNKKAYTPQLVSIGPFHHGREELKGMESHKKKYFNEFCKRTYMSNEDIQAMESNAENYKIMDEKVKEDLLSFTGKHFRKIWDYYAGTIEVDCKKFKELILIDACFIFELFIRFSLFRKKYLEKDYVLKTPWIMKAIKLDLILLENQLPFSFLEELFTRAGPKVKIETRNAENQPHAYPEKCCSINILSGITSCLNCASYNSSENKQQEATNNKIQEFRKLTMAFFSDNDYPATFDENEEIKHFTDLVRKSWIPKNLEKENECKMKSSSPVNCLYSATKLDKAGLNFVRAASKERLACVEITDGPCYKYFPFCRSGRQLVLSQFKIDDSTECLMRNVMALEQCLYPREAFICNYAALMSDVIETAEDIDFLVEKNIIKNFLGSSQDAADLANKLCQEIVETSFIYCGECEQLNGFYNSWFNATRATLKRVYFKDLWTASSTLVGICVLLFTTYATFKSIHKL